MGRKHVPPSWLMPALTFPRDGGKGSYLMGRTEGLPPPICLVLLQVLPFCRSHSHRDNHMAFLEAFRPWEAMSRDEQSTVPCSCHLR